MMTETPQHTLSTAREREHPGLKLLFELGPLAVFFFANLKGEWLAGHLPMLADLGGPIFVATGLFMAATALSLVLSALILRKLAVMPLVSGIVVFVFGALTLWLKDDTFIKVKPTIINTMFGAILLGGLAFGKPLLGYVFDSAFTLDDEGWRKLTLRWGIFFLCLAVLNEVIWRSLSTDSWVAFKAWGMMPITVVFTLAQMPLIMRHTIEPDAAGAAEKPSGGESR